MTVRETTEQAAISQYKGNKLVVIAFAGTGKTTTAVQFAKNNPDKRILYIAFNRSVADEAQAKFPANVVCKTAHQIAYAVVGKEYKHKETDNLSAKQIASALQLSNLGHAQAVLQTLTAFFCSGSEEISLAHVPVPEGTNLEVDEHEAMQKILETACHAWEKMKDLKDPMPMPHDGYLKLYQLSKPILWHMHDIIVFDEAQDANPVMSNIILSQQCQVIFIGDRHQQIYRFRGANNALDVAEMSDADKLYLTNSFRFGPKVAMVANSVLRLKGETRKVIGRGQQDSVVSILPEGVTKFTYLARTIAGAFECANALASKGTKLYWVGGIDKYKIQHFVDVYHFLSGNSEAVAGKVAFRGFNSGAEYRKFATTTKNLEMLRSIRMVEQLDRGIIDCAAAIKSVTVEHEEEADVVISTAHSAKGLEWPVVVLADDFPDLIKMLLQKHPQFDDEANLLYVAATRARTTLVINSTLTSVLRYEYVARHHPELVA